MSVPYTFATATTSIPLSQLDANFSYFANAITVQATTTAMTLDSSGNVGIGATTPTAKMQVYSNGAPAASGNMTTGVAIAAAAGSYAINIGSDATAGYTWLNSAFINGSSTASPMVFMTGASERARFDTSGVFLIATSSSLVSGASLQVNGTVASLGRQCRTGTGGSFGTNVFNINWTGSAANLYIDNSNVGTITLVSDYRIKKDVTSQTLSALDRISKIRPVTYTYQTNESLNWVEDGIQREGFIAHELAEIVPSAVDGDKDAPNQIQSLRLDALCSVLVKAIQELSEEVAILKAKVGA